jgi:hypothetical protein
MLHRSLATLVLLAAGAMPGCASRERAEPLVLERGAWDLVLAGSVSGSPGAEMWRRDAALDQRPVEAAVAREVAGADERPTLERSRRLYWPRSPYGYLYYLSPAERPHRWW